MASIIGDTGDDPRPPYGVLGIGVPGSFIGQDGDTVNVRAVGVFGVTGNRSDISNAMDDINSNLDMPVNAGIAGVLPTSSPTTLGYAAIGFLGGKNPFVEDLPMGAFGQSDHTGVAGITNNANGVGVFGSSTGGVANGVVGETTNAIGVTGRANAASGEGVRGENAHGGLAGHFVGSVRVDGNMLVNGNMEVTGAVTVDGDVFLRNRGDVAEQFGAIGECAPGSVMIIGESALLELCSRDYDKRAVGVVSGGGSLRPAITLGGCEVQNASTVSIAMVGTAFCLVDADRAAIEAGDLLTSSSTPGHAMKAGDPVSAFGAVIGKTLGSLPRGRGLVPIVISLQ